MQDLLAGLLVVLAVLRHAECKSLLQALSANNNPKSNEVESNVQLLTQHLVEQAAAPSKSRQAERCSCNGGRCGCSAGRCGCRGKPTRSQSADVDAEVVKKLLGRLLDNGAVENVNLLVSEESSEESAASPSLDLSALASPNAAGKDEDQLYIGYIVIDEDQLQKFKSSGGENFALSLEDKQDKLSADNLSQLVSKILSQSHSKAAPLPLVERDVASGALRLGFHDDDEEYED